MTMQDTSAAATLAAKEEREKDFHAKLDESRAKHRRVVGFNDDEFGPLIFKAATREILKRFVAETQGEGADMQVEAENLALECVVFPERGRLAAIFDELPGLALQASREIQRLSQSSSKAHAKK